MAREDMLTAEQAALEAAGLNEFFSLDEAASEIDKMVNIAKLQETESGFKDGVLTQYRKNFKLAHNTFELLIASFHAAHYEGEKSCLQLSDKECHPDPSIRDSWSLIATRESIAKLLLEQGQESCAQRLCPDIEQLQKSVEKEESPQERKERLTEWFQEEKNLRPKGALTRVAKREGRERQTIAAILNRE